MINIIIIDDQSLMCDGLDVILSADSDIKVVACGENGKAAISLCEKYNPDLILMDLRMPVMNGVEASAIIKARFPQVKILFLTTFDDEEDIINAMNSGASGYVFKDIEKRKLIEAIKECVKGTFIMPSKVASVLAKRAIEHDKDFNSCSQNVQTKESLGKLNLTDRELEIAIMISHGFSNKQIASALFISDGTVKNYVSTIYSKTGISDRIKLALYLNEKGIS